MALDILIVDDEEDIRDLVAGVLEDEGFTTRTAANSDSAIEALDSRRPSLVLLDVWLQGSRMDGLELLDEIKRRDPTIPVLMISGHGNIDTAVAAIRKGAADFIEKPFEADRLLHLVSRATETERLRPSIMELIWPFLRELSYPIRPHSRSAFQQRPGSIQPEKSRNSRLRTRQSASRTEPGHCCVMAQEQRTGSH